MVEGVSSEESEVADLDAICAMASASPAGDLRPPDLLVAPAYTSDIGLGGDAEPSMLRKPRIRLALGVGAGALLVIGLVIGLRRGGAEPARRSVAAAAAPAAPPPPDVVEAPPEAPLPVAAKLPPPPTTGAPASPPPPPRSAPALAMRKSTPAPAGPTMIKIRSDGTAAR